MSLLNLTGKKNNEIYSPNITYHQHFNFFKTTIFNGIYKSFKLITDAMIRDAEFDNKNKKTIFSLMGIRGNVDSDNIGNYYKKEYQRYKYIWSKKNVSSNILNEPYYNPLFNSKLKTKQKTTDFAIEFFKSISNN